MRSNQTFSYENLSKALEIFLPTLQERRQSITVNVFKNHFTLGFDCDLRTTKRGHTSASCDSPIDNVASRLYSSVTD